jgi:deoxyribodipyrimidine photo-lyase
MIRPELPTPGPDSFPPFPTAARKYLGTHDDDGLLEGLAKAKDGAKGEYDQRSMIAYKGGERTALERLEHYVTYVGDKNSGTGTSAGTDTGGSGTQNGNGTKGKGKLDPPLFTYKKTRNALTGLDGSTHFSPFLSLGTLSARHVFWRIRRAEEERQGGGNNDSYWLVFELLWRDYWKFAARGPLGDDKIFKLYGTLRDKVHQDPNEGRGGKGPKRGEKHGHDHMGGKGQLRQAQEHPPASQEWSHDERKFKAWRDGMTGVPFVDANMRELNATGDLFSVFNYSRHGG